MVIINYKFHNAHKHTQTQTLYTHTDTVTVLTYIQSHLLSQQTIPLVRKSDSVSVSVSVCVCMCGGIIIFHSFQFITHSSWGHPTAWRRE